MGISVYIDTCGYVKRAALGKIIPYAQKFLYDLKAISPDVHKTCTGQDNGIILDNLKFLIEQKCDVEIRYPFVVGWNHLEADSIGAFLRQLNFAGKIKVLQYHNFAGSKYSALGMENTLPDTTTTLDDLDRAVAVLKGYGLNAINGATVD
jgi:pyruvate formate lyase activating enzyme